LEILLAEDEKDIITTFKMALEVRSHRVIVTDNGQKCLELYHDKFQNIRYLTHFSANVQPFDIVILDYKMPQINGLNVAKEILAVNPHQRILFVSAYINSIVEESHATQQLLKQETIEVLQKPVSPKVMIDTIEDRAIYFKLEKFGVDMDSAKAANFTHKQLLFLRDFLERYEEEKHKKVCQQIGRLILPFILLMHTK
jgi:CheY-like chemotaxis protein